MTTRPAPSTLPVLTIIVLAVVSLVQLLAPDLIHPGFTLFLMGVVFLILYFIHWVREPLTLITGWVLAGFGLSFWALSLEAFAALGLPLILFGLGLAFVGIYLTSTVDEAQAIESRYWPLVPGTLLLLVGAILVLEGTIGRQRLWSVVVPLIPSVVAIWYLVEWRLRAQGERRE